MLCNGRAGTAAVSARAAPPAQIAFDIHISVNIEAARDGVPHIFGDFIHFVLEADPQALAHVLAQPGEDRRWAFYSEKALDVVKDRVHEAFDFTHDPVGHICDALPQPLDEVAAYIHHLTDIACESAHYGGDDLRDRFYDFHDDGRQSLDQCDE